MTTIISPHSVAIVGGTGGLGQYISQGFLTDFKANFHTIHILSRDPSSTAARELSAKGAVLHKLDEANLPRALDEAFKDVDVIVNALPTSAAVPDSTHEAIIEAVARSKANVYFLSEFGSDYRINDFPGYDHPDWLRKVKIGAESRQRLKGRKVIGLFTGAFAEFTLSVRFLGIDVANNTYTCYGSPTQRFSATSRADIGRSVARLAIVALDPATASKVPDELRVAGTTASYEDIRDLIAKTKGIPKGEVKSEDLAVLKARIRQDPGKNFLDYIHVVFGEGKADFSAKNDNELINPGERFWKWTKFEDYASHL
ncbi:NAD(P)-binding protein [Trametes meyenii]|nr:NAD(P)-binding protein [Trametes meyenii]